MRETYEIYQSVLVHICVMACAILSVSLFFYKVVVPFMLPIWDAVRRYVSLHTIEKCLIGIFVCGMIYCGATKPTIRWDTGLYDDGSEITNNTVAIRWRYSGIPSASTIYIDYRPNGSTNEWHGLGESVASALAWNGTVTDATNYDYYVYSTYIPPVPVHTNGVWVGQAYETKARVGAKAFLVIGGRITDNGNVIAPPISNVNERNE